MFPQARSKGLLVRELADEVLIYDLESDKAHSLNEIAALVWKHCNGQTSIAEIAATIRETLKRPADETSVELALEQLSKRNLLIEPVSPPTPEVRQARREMLKKLAFAMAIPAVISVNAPAALAQASPLPTTTTGSGTTTTGSGTTTTSVPTTTTTSVPTTTTTSAPTTTTTTSIR